MKKIEIKKYKKLTYNKNGYYYEDNNENLIDLNKKLKRIIILLVIIIILIISSFMVYLYRKTSKGKKYIISAPNSFINQKNYDINNNQISNLSESNINYINVAYALDNYYHYIIHVSMKSIMLSQNPNTFINFYILTSSITDEQKEVIDKIGLQHKNCKIEYIDMGNQFKDLNVPLDTYAQWSTAIFYRLLLQYLLPNEERILYLDGDTLIYKDLTKIYNYNITDKYYVGMLEYKYFGYARYFKERFGNYINTGVLLCNLKELRKGNIAQKFVDFYKEYNTTIRFPVNDALNVISHEKNGYFEPEYVVIGFCNQKTAYEYYNKAIIKLNSTAVRDAYKDPYIYHLIYYSKPWKNVPKEYDKVCVDPFIRFYEMARKTDYYYDILEKFSISGKD